MKVNNLSGKLLNIKRFFDYFLQLLIVATDYIWGPPQAPSYGQIKKQDIPVRDDPQEPSTENVKEKQDKEEEKQIDAGAEKCMCSFLYIFTYKRTL